MSLQGPMVVVAGNPAHDHVHALASRGVFPLVEASWAEAPAAITSIEPAAVVLAEPPPSQRAAAAIARRVETWHGPYLPVIARGDGSFPMIARALPVPMTAPLPLLIGRLAAALRVRALHMTVLRRLEAMRGRGGIPELPAGDPLADASVLVVGRGRSHPALTVAFGERIGLIGAFSLETAARYLNVRELDGVVIGDGLGARMIEAFLTALSEDTRFRDLPAVLVGNPLGTFQVPRLPNFDRLDDPARAVDHFLPLVRQHAFAARLKRMLHSLETKGMLDPETGLLTEEAFASDLTRAVDEAIERGAELSIARFVFEHGTRRSSLDAARLIGRLIRNVDFACREPEGSIVAVFTGVGLRVAHVAARRIASVLKRTMLAAETERAALMPTITLATLKPTDTALSLMSRVAGASAIAAE